MDVFATLGCKVTVFFSYMQGFAPKSFGKVDFARNLALICWLLCGLFGFEGLIDHRADEVVEAEETLRGVGGLVDRSMWVGTCATCAWQLSSVAFAVVSKQGLGFLFSEDLWALGKDGDGRCLVGFVGT